MAHCLTCSTRVFMYSAPLPTGRFELGETFEWQATELPDTLAPGKRDIRDILVALGGMRWSEDISVRTTHLWLDVMLSFGLNTLFVILPF